VSSHSQEIEREFDEKFRVVPFNGGQDYESEYPSPEEFKSFIRSQLLKQRAEFVSELEKLKTFHSEYGLAVEDNTESNRRISALIEKYKGDSNVR
jgi:hypothetical protein